MLKKQKCWSFTLSFFWIRPMLCRCVLHACLLFSLHILTFGRFFSLCSSLIHSTFFYCQTLDGYGICIGFSLRIASAPVNVCGNRYTCIHMQMYDINLFSNDLEYMLGSQYNWQTAFMRSNQAFSYWYTFYRIYLLYASLLQWFSVDCYYYYNFAVLCYAGWALSMQQIDDSFETNMYALKKRPYNRSRDEMIEFSWPL